MRRFNFKKTVQAIHCLGNFGLNRNSKERVLVLLWLCDRLKFSQHGQGLTWDTYLIQEGFGFHPVNSSKILYEKSLKTEQETKYRNSFLDIGEIFDASYFSTGNCDLKKFSQVDIQTINKITKHTSDMLDDQLFSMYRNFPEYTHKTKNGELDYQNFLEPGPKKYDGFLGVDPKLTNLLKEIQIYG